MKPHVTRCSDRDDYCTPPPLISRLDQVFHFTHDMAATKKNTIVHCFFYEDTLKDSWGLGGSIWCNPPFSNKEKFFERGIEARNQNRVTVFMAAGNARETEWWQKYALQADEIINLIPRVNYFLDGEEVTGVGFPSCLLVYYPRLPGIVTTPRESYWNWRDES